MHAPALPTQSDSRAGLHACNLKPQTLSQRDAQSWLRILRSLMAAYSSSTRRPGVGMSGTPPASFSLSVLQDIRGRSAARRDHAIANAEQHTLLLQDLPTHAQCLQSITAVKLGCGVCIFNARGPCPQQTSVSSNASLGSCSTVLTGGAPDVNDERIAIIADSVQGAGCADIARIATEAAEDRLDDPWPLTAIKTSIEDAFHSWDAIHKIRTSADRCQRRCKSEHTASLQLCAQAYLHLPPADVFKP